MLLWLAILGGSILDALAQIPKIRIHEREIGVQDCLYADRGPETYRVGTDYTFEVYMEGTTQNDYVIERCTMNGVPFIGDFGCVQCSTHVLRSIETEQYNQPSSMKRTLVVFKAPTTLIHFVCQVRVLQCCGCAERSCERRPALLGIPAHIVPLSYGTMFPVGGYRQPPAIGAQGGYAIGMNRNWAFPWWLWLLLALLLLLLILCCIACCLAVFARKRSKRTTLTRIATAAECKGVGVGTDAPALATKGTATTGSLSNPNHDTLRCTPAVAVLDCREIESRAAAINGGHGREHREDRFDAYSTSRGGYPVDREPSSGVYSVRDGRMTNERFTRHGGVSPPGGATGQRDRSSYRNFAYERDMGRVAPMSGFDEVETTERRYCLSDDECDVIEKDIKRTHTTRFVQETRTTQNDNDSDSGSEKFREEGVHTAVYAQSLPV